MKSIKIKIELKIIKYCLYLIIFLKEKVEDDVENDLVYHSEEQVVEGELGVGVDVEEE